MVSGTASKLGVAVWVTEGEPRVTGAVGKFKIVVEASGLEVTGVDASSTGAATVSTLKLVISAVAFCSV